MRTIPLSEVPAHLGTVTTSPWFEIGQDRIDTFADVTDDHQFIHVDPVAAAATPFGGTIAHGFLTLSLLSAMAAEAMLGLEGMRLGINYGFDKVRFLQPVAAGRRVRGHFELSGHRERSPGEHLFTYGVTVEIEGEDKPALAARWLTLQHVGPAEEER